MICYKPKLRIEMPVWDKFKIYVSKTCKVSSIPQAVNFVNRKSFIIFHILNLYNSQM